MPRMVLSRNIEGGNGAAGMWDVVASCPLLWLSINLLLFLPCLIGFVSPAFQLMANFSSFHISDSSDS